MSRRKLGQPGSKSRSYRPILLSYDQIDMSYLRLSPDESLTY
jgi:hypothetical protein